MACTVDVSESRLVRRPGREDDEFKNRTGQRVVMPAANALNTPPPDFPSCPDLGPGSTVAPADLHSLRFTDIAPYPTVFSAVDRRAGQRSSRSADYEAGDGYDPLYPPPRSLGACGDSETVAVHLSHSAQELSILLRPAAESLGITYESRGKLSHLMASKPTGHVSIELSEQPAVPEKASGALDAGTTNRNAAANFSVTSTPTCVATDLHSDNGGDGRRRQSGLPNALGAANDQLLTEDNKVEADARANMKRLKTAIALCSVFFVVELCGGLFAGSLALLSDSFHLLSDCVSFVISLLAIRLSRKKSTKEFTFGYQRAEVIGALLSVFLIWGLTAELCLQAIGRFANPSPVEGKVMFAVAACGVCVNVVLAFALHGHHGHGHGHDHGRRDGHCASHGHSPQRRGHGNPLEDDPGYYLDHYGHRRRKASIAHIRLHGVDREEKPQHDDGDVTMESIPLDDDVDHGNCETRTTSSKKSINMRAATLHVIGDLLSSVGVLIASVVIMLGGPSQVDPVCTFLFSAMVFATTVGVAKESISVLMEGAPREADVLGLVASLRALPGVVNVHGLHVWELTTRKPSLSVHLVVRSAERTPAAPSSSFSSSFPSTAAHAERSDAGASYLLNEARAAAARHGCGGCFCAVQLEPETGFRCEEREDWHLESWEREV